MREARNKKNGFQAVEDTIFKVFIAPTYKVFVKGLILQFTSMIQQNRISNNI